MTEVWVRKYKYRIGFRDELSGWQTVAVAGDFGSMIDLSVVECPKIDTGGADFPPYAKFGVSLSNKIKKSCPTRRQASEWIG
jgi:hypothetical protein